MGTRLASHRQLEVYNKAFEVAMQIFEISKGFPRSEMYSLTDQIRRSSRSVCANLAEAWRRRRYEGAFVSKLSDAEAEAGETQTWIEFAVSCAYVTRKDGAQLYRRYNEVLATLVGMIHHCDKWTLPPRQTS